MGPFRTVGLGLRRLRMGCAARNFISSSAPRNLRCPRASRCWSPPFRDSQRLPSSPCAPPTNMCLDLNRSKRPRLPPVPEIYSIPTTQEPYLNDGEGTRLFPYTQIGFFLLRPFVFFLAKGWKSTSQAPLPTVFVFHQFQLPNPRALTSVPWSTENQPERKREIVRSCKTGAQEGR